MPEFGCLGTTELVLRKTPPGVAGFGYDGNVFFGPEDSTKITLENSLVSFVFQQDNIGGIYLSTFTRKGTEARAWTNYCRDIWKVHVWDTGAVSANDVGEICPRAHDFSTTGIQVDDQGGQFLDLIWSDVLVWNNDLFDLTIRISLGRNDDFVTAKILQLAWQNSAEQYAIDSVTVLPLRIKPSGQPDDFAVSGYATGVQVSNPIVKLRYDYDGNPANPKAGFANYRTNYTVYPSGFGQRMPLWGYYEVANCEGWMCWAEDHPKELLYTVFQSDGFNMQFENYIPQPEMMKPRNGAYANSLGTGWTFCLRAFQTSQPNGWWDMAQKYKERLELKKPYFRQPPRLKDERLSSIERHPFLWVQTIQTNYPGDQSVLVGRLNKIREVMGVGLEYPIFGNATFTHYVDQPLQPFNRAAGTARRALLKARGEQIYLGPHQFDQFYPKPHDFRRFPDTTNVWKDKDLIHSLRLSRRGKFAGGDDAHLGEETGTFFAEEQKTVVAFNPSSRVLSFDSPLVNTYPGDSYVVVEHTRPDQTKVLLLGQNEPVTWPAGLTSITVTAPFFVNADLQPEDPQFGDIVHFANNAYECHHAILNSAYYDWIKKYTWGGLFEILGSGVFYSDVELAKIVIDTKLGDTTLPCFSDHSNWSQLPGSYVPHPQGGGSWYLDAKRKFYLGLFDYLRQRSKAVYGVEVAVFTSEYHDESVLDHFPIDVQGASHGRLWRGINSVDYANTGFVMVPLFAVVHGGRGLAWMYNNIFSNAVLLPSYRNGQAISTAFSKAFIRLQGAWLLTDWPLGITLPAFAHYLDETTGAADIDLWDESQYEDSHPGGAADPDIRKIRDALIQLLKFENTWLFDYLRNGDMLPPATLEAGTTLVTAPHGTTLPLPGGGVVDPTTYFATPNIYPHDAFPAVTHAIWRNPDTGRVCVVMSNWTAQDSVLDATYDFVGYGLPSNQSVAVFQVQEDGCPVLIGTFTASAVELKTTVAAFSATTLLFVLESETVFVKPEITDLTVRATFTAGELLISWKLPGVPSAQQTKYAYPKVKDVILVRKQGSYPRTVTDGTIVYVGTDTSFLDKGLQSGQAYHYVAFASDGAKATTT